MGKRYAKGLFIFHRDLRIIDNVGLIQAFTECEKVYTCFIFTPEQVGFKNAYRSTNAIRFMIESLSDLSSEIHKHGGELIVLYGKPTTISRVLIQTLDVSAVYVNKDYSPYAVERDTALASLCKAQHVAYHESSDYYLYEPGSITTTTGKYYQKYTPFYDAVVHRKVEGVYPYYKRHTDTLSKYSGSIPHTITLAKMFHKYVGESRRPDYSKYPEMVRGGRAEGTQRLKRAVKEHKQYTKDRDDLVYETTRLSAYIKFGCVSIREVYHAFVHAYGRSSGLIRELIWREFFAHILYGFPGVLNGYVYKGIRWRTSRADFQKWQRGNTGVPVVDACMRQMNATGFMHNRGRMIVANFLVKTLLINWKWGEEYFAEMLTDYDPASNNGNWQSVSGTGVDQKPYFRDMNPWIQSAKADPNAEYIKRWVPELADVAPKEIHKWESSWNDPKHRGIRYPKPMVIYSEQKEKMLDMYRHAHNQ
jgi:deoxyribodipyrimidine photo-lyase